MSAAAIAIAIGSPRGWSTMKMKKKEKEPEFSSTLWTLVIPFPALPAGRRDWGGAFSICSLLGFWCFDYWTDDLGRRNTVNSLLGWWCLKFWCSLYPWYLPFKQMLHVFFGFVINFSERKVTYFNLPGAKSQFHSLEKLWFVMGNDSFSFWNQSKVKKQNKTVKP